MAMSQGERMMRLQESSNRFLSRQQTTSSWNHTREILQPRSSGTVFPANRTPTNQAIQGSVVVVGSAVPNTRDSAIGKNVYSADGAPIGCCATVVASGSGTFDEQNAIIQKAQSVACCNKINQYWNYNGYSIDVTGNVPDLSGGFITGIKGGVCCPLPPLPNTAQVPGYIKCSMCQNFYFPKVPQSSTCLNCPTDYKSYQYYPPPPIDWELRRYGDGRVPEECGAIPTIANFGIVGLAPGVGPWIVAWNQTGATSVGAQVFDQNGDPYAATITFDSLNQITIADFTAGARGATYSVTITLVNQCGSIGASGTFDVNGSG